MNNIRLERIPAYVSLNPALFDSADHWSYRDLQRLAKRINLPAGGRRDELVERLQAWHREQRSSDQSGKFHSVEVRASPAGKPISPRLMSPLVGRSRSNSGILLTPSEAPRSPLMERSVNGVAFSPVRLPPAFFLRHLQMHDARALCYSLSVQHGKADPTKGAVRNVRPVP